MGVMQSLNQLEDRLPGPRIEVAGGLIRQKNLGLGHQRPRQGDPLLLARRSARPTGASPAPPDPPLPARTPPVPGQQPDPSPEPARA